MKLGLLLAFSAISLCVVAGALIDTTYGVNTYPGPMEIPGPPMYTDADFDTMGIGGYGGYGGIGIGGFGLGLGVTGTKKGAAADVIPASINYVVGQAVATGGGKHGGPGIGAFGPPPPPPPPKKGGGYGLGGYSLGGYSLGGGKGGSNIGAAVADVNTVVTLAPQVVVPGAAVAGGKAAGLGLVPGLGGYTLNGGKGGIGLGGFGYGGFGHH